MDGITRKPFCDFEELGMELVSPWLSEVATVAQVHRIYDMSTCLMGSDCTTELDASKGGQREAASPTVRSPVI